MAFGATRLNTGQYATPKSLHLNNRSPSSRSSPIRGPRSDQILNLKQVIGTTATSNNGFDCLENGNAFAFIAGSGAVLASFTSGQAASQRFFRARPAATPLNSTPSVYDSPTPAGGARSRAAASLRDSSFGPLAYGSPMNDYLDSPTTKSATRTKASTCVSLSPDGRLLAIGETGHKPRVLIFSTAKDASTDIPLTALSEHTFGVRCLAFSPDSQYLASLGDMNDGFLYVWSVNPRTGSATLHASNKCTSVIRQIAWMGNSLITVGTRHVKIWRIEDNTPGTPSGRNSPNKRTSDIGFAFTSPTSKVLVGRNCLLGALLDKIFTSVARISSSKALVCSDQGDVCLLDDSEYPPQFTKIAELSFAITAVAVYFSTSALIAGTKGQFRLFNLHDCSSKEINFLEGSLEKNGTEMSQVNALGLLGNRPVTIDDQKSIQIFDPPPNIEEDTTYNLIHRFPAHGTSVLGLQAFSSEVEDRPSFLTWSAEGTVLFWAAHGTCKGDLVVKLEQLPQGGDEYRNELKVVRAFGGGKYLASGDKFGVFRIIEIADNKTVYDSKAHASDITDLAICDIENSTLIASSGRDRTVQIFQWRLDTCEHLQTLEEHTGAVTGLLFSRDGDRLISCSSDRSIMIMDAVYREKNSTTISGFLSSRPLVLKSSPVSMDLLGCDSLLVSTIDRTVLRYDLNSGNLTSSFKAIDQDGGDAVVINSIAHVSIPRHPTLIAGVSGTDKSIRIYDESGRLLEREYGHTEGMTGIATVSAGEQGKILVSVATDGTVFVWEPTAGQDQLSDLLSSMDLSNDHSRSSSTLSSRPTLRKVISSSELTQLKSLREEVSQDQEREKSATPSQNGRTVKKKSSRLSMFQTPKLEPTIGVGVSDRRASQAPGDHASIDRPRRSSTRPSSPSTQKQYAQTVRATSRPPQISAAEPDSQQHRPLARRKSASASTSATSSPRGSLAASKDTVCRALHSFRKELVSAGSDSLAPESIRALERELSLTAQALAERTSKSKRRSGEGGSGTGVSRLLDAYSERLVELLEGRIEKSVERKIEAQMGTATEQGVAPTQADVDVVRVEDCG